MNEMLYPSVIGIVYRGDAVLPSPILTKALPSPVAHVEGRIGKDEVRLQVFMHVIVEAVGIVRAEIGVDPANGQVHLCQSPCGGIGFLPVDNYIAKPSACSSTKRSLWTNMPPEPPQGS